MESDRQTHLYCPRCEGQDVEAQAVINAKTEFLREDSKLQQKNIPTPLKKYRKHELLYYLITRINKHAHRFFERNGILISEFGYLPELIRELFREDGFGDQRLTSPDEIDEEITTLRDGYAILHRALRDSTDGFAICVKDDKPSVKFTNFIKDYELLPSEKQFCFQRLSNSLICGDASNYKTYTIVADTLRQFRDRNRSSPETVEEFADFWYQFIMQLKMTASLDEFVNDVYYSQLSDEITILQIETFLEELNCSLDRIKWEKAKEGRPVPVDREVVDAAGEKAFGESWETVKDQLIVSKHNPSGHSFLFEIEETKELPKSDESGTATISERTLVYPKDYARLLKFQIFPLLRNEGTDTDSGHTLLKRLTEKRSERYEENVYNYTKDKSVECYLRPEIRGSDGSELDILRVLDDEIHFIELKLLVPPPHLRREEGMTVLNEKFDLAIFNEESERVYRTATGKTFPEKMEMWLDLDTGNSFTADMSTCPQGRESKTIGEEWWEKDIKRFVVSNLTPTYVEKDGIRFLTDFEYVELMLGNESVLYPIWDGRREQNR